MIQFSIPAALSIFAATSAVAVTSVAIAVPAVQPTSTPTVSATSTSTSTPTPTPTVTAVPGGGGESPLADYPNHIIMGGIGIHDLQMGFTTTILPTGVLFAYVGECIGERTIITVWGNNGLMKSTGGGYCATIAPGQMTHSSVGMTWNEDIRNAYCNSPQGAATAYRAEIYGMFSEWVPIPEEYKQCVNGRAPEGPLPPGEVAPSAPVNPPSTVPPADAPPTTELITPTQAPVPETVPAPTPMQ